jgi:hypothetical protein
MPILLASAELLLISLLATLDSQSAAPDSVLLKDGGLVGFGKKG